MATAAAVVAVPLSQTAFAVNGGSAMATAASVNINSNVEPIDLNLQGSTETVEAPPSIGNVSNDEDLDVQYVDSSFVVDVFDNQASRFDEGSGMAAGLDADSNTDSAVLTLLREPVLTVGQVGSSSLCPSTDEPAGGLHRRGAGRRLGGRTGHVAERGVDVEHHRLRGRHPHAGHRQR